MASPLSANAQRHGNWPSAYRPLTNCMYQFETLNLSLEEKMILNAIASDPHLKQQQMTELIHKSIATVKRITIGLQEKGILRRDNGKRDGFWTIIYDEK